MRKRDEISPPAAQSGHSEQVQGLEVHCRHQRKRQECVHWQRYEFRFVDLGNLVLEYFSRVMVNQIYQLKIHRLYFFHQRRNFVEIIPVKTGSYGFETALEPTDEP